MRGPAVRPIVIAAGGTGGHFFPAEALAAELLARGHRVALMTDARSASLGSAVFAGCERFVLAGAGLSGRGARAVIAAAGLARGVLQARNALRRLDAAVVVGFGGYPCVAPVIAAHSLGRRRPAVVLHEQNAVLGRANRLLAPRADVLALSFERTQSVPSGVATVVVGNPVRPGFSSLAYDGPTATVRLLVLGGSLGARVFSDVVPAALALLDDAARGRLRVVQQCRAEDVSRVRDAYAAMPAAAELATFFDDMPARLAAAHLVISRAGASTIAELALVGRPSILVPLPHAIDDHQSANASVLGDAGAACIVPQAEFTPERLAGLLTDVLEEPAHLAEAAHAAGAVAHLHAAETLADTVEALVAERVA